jgi:carboxypeptidase family protein
MWRRTLFISRAFFATSLFLASNCWAQQLTANTRSSEKPIGAITGRVINSAGEPIAGADVSASSLGANAHRKTVAVDSHGDFKIDGLEPGLYSVFASMRGYVFGGRSSAESPKYYRIGDSVTITLSKGGVITGTVTGPNGPLVGVGVFASRVRDEDGKKLAASFPGYPERRTDDRGVFRLYGLLPGAYLLVATRPRLGTILPSAYDNDVPTYYPSATRDTASEIIVREGDEITADIQYRGEPGHAISGKLTGLVDLQNRFGATPSITLTEVNDGIQIANSPTSLTNNSSFAIYGVPDGEYEVSARQFLPTRDELRSAPQRVIVRGADVAGLNLILLPLASIEGRLVFENYPKGQCAQRRETAPSETLVYARHHEPEKKSVDARATETQAPVSTANYSASAVGDAKGSFTLRNLPTGSYQIDSPAPASGWYLRSIAIGPAQPVVRTTSPNTARDGVSVRSGEHITGLVVTFTEGAASLRGRISIAKGQTPPPRLRVYLAPAEREAAGNVLRFYESPTEMSGSFTVDNLAPGKYWIMARPAEGNDSGATKFVRQDAAFRAKVLQEAQALNKTVTLKPCEQIGDLEVPYSIPASQQ